MLKLMSKKIFTTSRNLFLSFIWLGTGTDEHFEQESDKVGIIDFKKKK